MLAWISVEKQLMEYEEMWQWKWIKYSEKLSVSSILERVHILIGFEWMNEKIMVEYSENVVKLAVFRQGTKPPICPSFWRLGPRF